MWMLSSFFFFNPANAVHNAVRGDVLTQFAPLAPNNFGLWLCFLGGFHPSWTLVGLAVIGAFFLAMCGVVVVRGQRELLKKGLGPAFAFLIVSSVIAARSNDSNKPEPVVTVKDIEIKSYRCDHTGAEITWTCGTNVVVGVDRFIIQRAERQIPARTGWSSFSDYSESMTTNWATSTPQHAQDVRFRVIVRKEMP